MSGRRSAAGWLLLALAIPMQGAGLAGCSTSAPDKRILQYLNTDGFGKRYTGNAEEENYVTLGDTVSFIDALNPELRSSARVDIDGTIIVPEAGAVVVAGLTRTEIEGLLTQKLSPYYTENDIRVTIVAARKFYYVIGEIGVEGRRPFPGDLTILDAVLQARPTEHTSNLGRVQLIRADPRDPFILPVDISNMLKSGDTTFNVHVQENDIIYIPPTILKEVADFIAALVVPVTDVFRSIFQSLFLFRFGGLGGQGFGRNRGLF